MKIIPEKDVRAQVQGDLSCPYSNCSTRFNARSRNRPKLVDQNGRPYCDAHAKAVSTAYKDLAETFDGAVKAVAKAVQTGEMTSADATFYYELWDAPQPDP
jgi:hypothetical protein